MRQKNTGTTRDSTLIAKICLKTVRLKNVFDKFNSIFRSKRTKYTIVHSSRHTLSKKSTLLPSLNNFDHVVKFPSHVIVLHFSHVSVALLNTRLKNLAMASALVTMGTNQLCRWMEAQELPMDVIESFRGDQLGILIASFTVFLQKMKWMEKLWRRYWELPKAPTA